MPNLTCSDSYSICFLLVAAKHEIRVWLKTNNKSPADLWSRSGNKRVFGMTVITYDISSICRDVVQYQCEEGYLLVGDEYRECESNGTWSGRLPVCHMVHCPLPRDPPHGSYTAHTLVYNAVATLLCHLGYQMDGLPDIHCTSAGNWTESEGYCVLVSCGPPPSVDNSRVIGGEFTYHSKVTYQCAEGFELRGVSERICQADRVWTGNTPHCDRIRCPPPPSIAHAHTPSNLTSTSVEVGLSRATPPWLYGDAVTYHCVQGHRLVGGGMVTCLADGMWGPGTPQCSRVLCTLPPGVTHGNFSLTGREAYMESLLVTCNIGYESTGDRWIECQSDGIWNVTGAACDVISCPVPDPIPNASVRVDTVTYGSTVRYQCDMGFRLQGPSTRLCNHLKRWSDREPVCRIKRCPRPRPITHGKVKGNMFEYKSTVSYFCDKGYKLSGELRRTCQNSGSWTGAPPTCSIIFCPVPSDVSYGQVQYTNRTYGSRAEYSCEEGHQLHGIAIRTCAADGLWTGMDPRCDKVRCPVPNPIPHGSYTGDQLTYGSLVTYTCHNDYEIVGAAVRRCQADKTWSGSMPACQLKMCQEKPFVLHGSVIGTDFSSGLSVEFVCDKGYQLLGPSSSTCTAGTHWNQPFPTCNRISCGLPKLIENSYTDGNSYEYGDRVSYRCKNGYEMSGDPWIECEASGKWGAASGSCQPVNCGVPPSVSSATVHGDSFTLHGFIYYRCVPGYEMSGNNHLQCGAGGEWVGELPTCDMVVCGDVPVIRHATTTLTRHFFGSRAIYECNIGYVLHGSAMVECDSSGHWSFMGQRSSCEPVDCGQPPAITNGNVLAPNSTYQSMARYECSEGFQITGSTLMECRHDGVWEGEIPRCVSVTCPRLSPPVSGELRGVGFTYLSLVQFACQLGFRLVGDSERTCLANGTWSGHTPNCEGGYLAIIYTSIYIY